MNATIKPSLTKTVEMIKIEYVGSLAYLGKCQWIIFDFEFEQSSDDQNREICLILIRHGKLGSRITKHKSFYVLEHDCVSLENGKPIVLNSANKKSRYKKITIVNLSDLLPTVITE